MISFFLFLFVIVGGSAQNDINKTYVPDWQQLECEQGHKYLFSEITHNWEDAIAECILYRGWLLDVKDQKEHNCLMRYGISQGYNEWFYTDVNDQSSYGTWVHASTNKDVTWFPQTINCYTDGTDYKKSAIHGGDIMLFGIFSHRPDGRNGAWCDWVSSDAKRFICKAQI